MNLHEIDLNLLSAFEALFAEQHVTRAARRVGISQPAMSDALRRLRLLFGDVLFVRASGGMQPTPRCISIARQLVPVLADVRSVMGRQVAFDPQHSDKTFVIASTDYTSMVMLPLLVPMLRGAAPGVDVRLIGYQKEAVGGLLERGEIDAAFGVFPTPPDSAVRQPLFDEHFVGLARADHPLMQGGAITPEAFAAIPQALVSVNGDDRSVIDTDLGRLGLRRRVALVIPYMLLLPSVLAQSDLIAVVPRRAADAVATSGLMRFELPFATSAWTVDMLWNPAARTDNAGAWLRRIIVERASAI
jgi:DNA-binding transcriptional LysR family regulator